MKNPNAYYGYSIFKDIVEFKTKRTAYWKSLTTSKETIKRNTTKDVMVEFDCSKGYISQAETVINAPTDIAKVFKYYLENKIVSVDTLVRVAQGLEKVNCYYASNVTKILESLRSQSKDGRVGRKAVDGFNWKRYAVLSRADNEPAPTIFVDEFIEEELSDGSYVTVCVQAPVTTMSKSEEILDAVADLEQRTLAALLLEGVPNEIALPHARAIADQVYFGN